jgi:SAM-dependent methyltransferase
MNKSQHWNSVYQTKPSDTVSWYTPHLDDSLALVEQFSTDKQAAVIDIGGGESTLVDDLLAKQYQDISVLDISATAIDHTKNRLGTKAKNVAWYVGDITQFDFKNKQFDIWHDRAVFHFLTEPSARLAYVELVRKSVKPGGHVIMATFGPDGPLKCSGLDIVRYDDAHLHGEFGNDFELVGSKITHHHTPTGGDQQFLYCWCKVC